MPAHLENSAVATGLEKVSFLPISKKGNAKECSNYCTIAHISHPSKVMLKFSKPGFSSTWTMNFQMFKLDFKMAEGSEIKQWTHSLLNKILDENEKCVLKTEATFWPTQYGSKLSKWGFNSMWIENFQMFKLDLENAEEPEIKLLTSTRSRKKQESSRKTSTSALLTMPKPLTVWITTNWKILQEMGILDHLTYLLRNLYAGQEATVRTGHGTTDWFQIQKEICQGCILSLCLFNLYAEYITRNAGLDEAQAGIKIPGEISITSDMQMTPPLWQKVKRN